MTLMRLLLLSCLILGASGALAARIEIPLRVSLDTVRQALESKLGVIYRQGACRYLKLGAPEIAAVDGRLRLVSPGSAALGVELAGNCQTAAAWRGSMQFTLAPRLDSAGRLRLRIVDSKLTDAGGGTAAGFIWDLSKHHVHPRLQQFGYDIGASSSALAAVMRGAAPPEHSAALELALTQMQVLEPRVEATEIVVPVALEIPDAWLTANASTTAPAAPLTEAEIEALDKALQPWDAFLVYTIKQLALDNEDSEVRRRLFTLLLESRYELAAILSGETRTAGDPVRALFLDAWSEMRTILADARYAVFLDAGDALAALDRAAPGLGMRLSADGLRQLARSLRPGATDDPLAYDWTVDPELGRLFEIEDISEAEPTGTSSLQFFIKASAGARALDRWVPRRDELDAYEARIGELLRKETAIELSRAGLAAAYAKIYRQMVPATALIESCWRQYVVRAGKVSYLRSGSGSVGIMQINQIVWRGFYSIERLRWSTAYNARAGAQILMRYLKDYAIPYAERTGDPNHIPRAAYAVYNAGPRAVGRFNKVPRHPREARVDERLWSLYQGMASGGQIDLKNCAVTAAAASQ